MKKRKINHSRRVNLKKLLAPVGNDGVPDAALSADVDVSPMNLQNVFVALCGHGDAQ